MPLLSIHNDEQISAIVCLARDLLILLGEDAALLHRELAHVGEQLQLDERLALELEPSRCCPRIVLGHVHLIRAVEVLDGVGRVAPFAKATEPFADHDILSQRLANEG